jgi:hypothetical protein
MSEVKKPLKIELENPREYILGGGGCNFDKPCKECFEKSAKTTLDNCALERALLNRDITIWARLRNRLFEYEEDLKTMPAELAPLRLVYILETALVEDLRKVSKHEKNLMIALRKTGLSIHKIAQVTGRSSSTVQGYVGHIEPPQESDMF